MSICRIGILKFNNICSVLEVGEFIFAFAVRLDGCSNLNGCCCICSVPKGNGNAFKHLVALFGLINTVAVHVFEGKTADFGNRKLSRNIVAVYKACAALA